MQEEVESPFEGTANLTKKKYILDVYNVYCEN